MTTSLTLRALLPALALGLALPAALPARTKLVTLPDRSARVLSLEHPGHVLLYEERDIALQQGTNQIDFSWNGVNIDAGSVQVELLTNPGTADTATKVIATGFPPNEAALTWQVYSPTPRTERIRVSYLLYGVAQDSAYEFHVNKDETSGAFEQYLRLGNQSGETLEGTVLRMGVMDDVTRTVASGETRRFLARKAPALPVSKLYIARPAPQNFRGEEGEEISLVYEIENSSAGGLGGRKLPGGKVRLFGDDGLGSSIFLGEDILGETAPGEKAELQLGLVKDIVLKRRLMRDERLNIRYNSSRSEVLFDQERALRYEIENFKDKPVTLRIHELVSGDWEVTEVSDASARQERKSIEDLQLSFDLPAARKGEPPAKKVVDVVLRVKNRFPGEQ